MVRYVRRQLGWKLFLSYFAVVLVGAVVLVAAMEFTLPQAFTRHLAAMETAMLTMGPHGPINRVSLTDDLVVNFRTAVTEATTIALITASLIALAFSALMTRRIVRPVRQIRKPAETLRRDNTVVWSLCPIAL